MRFKLTVFLLLANLVVFGFIFRGLGSGNDAVRNGASVFSTGITSVAVSSSSATDAFALEQRGKDWFVTKPFEWPANPFAVNDLLNELRFLGSDGGFSVDEALSMGNTLASYGLEVPGMVVTVSDDSGSHVLKIGRATADGSSVYALSPDGKRIIPAPKSLVATLSKKSENFRVSEIFLMRPYEVQSISVRSNYKGGNEQRIGLVRAKRESRIPGKPAEHFWRFETPISADAETVKTESKLGQLTSLTYRRFIGNDLALYDQSGLRSPQMRFTLEGAKKNQTLLVGNPDPMDKSGETLFAKLENNDAIFTVPADLVNGWRDATLELRDPYFFRFEPSLLSAITINEGDRVIVLHRTELSTGAGTTATSAPQSRQPAHDTEIPLVGAIAKPLPTADAGDAAIYNSWQMPVAPGARVTSVTNVEPTVLRELVEKLSNLKAERFNSSVDKSMSQESRRLMEAFVTDMATTEDVVAMKFNTPLRIVELQLRDPQSASAPPQLMTLTIAPRMAPGSPIHAKVGTSIYSIPDTILDDLSTEPTFFRDRKIYKLPMGAGVASIKLIDVSGKTEKVIYDEKRPDGADDWVASLLSKPEPFTRALAALVGCVGDVSADGFLPDKFSRDFEFDYLNSGAPETWRYRLEVGVKLAGDSGARVSEQHIYYLTKRLGGTFQLAGSPEQNCIFKLSREFIDAVHELTFAVDASKDVPEIKIPESVGKPAPNIVPVSVKRN